MTSQWQYQVPGVNAIWGAQTPQMASNFAVPVAGSVQFAVPTQTPVIGNNTGILGYGGVPAGLVFQQPTLSNYSSVPAQSSLASSVLQPSSQYSYSHVASNIPNKDKVALSGVPAVTSFSSSLYTSQYINPSRQPISLTSSGNTSQSSFMPSDSSQPPISPRFADPQQQTSWEDFKVEESSFKTQYDNWMKQFSEWEEKNKNHPDKDQFRSYMQQWRTYEQQMDEQRNQLRVRRNEFINEWKRLNPAYSAANKCVGGWKSTDRSSSNVADDMEVEPAEQTPSSIETPRLDPSRNGASMTYGGSFPYSSTLTQSRGQMGSSFPPTETSSSSGLPPHGSYRPPGVIPQNGPNNSQNNFPQPGSFAAQQMSLPTAGSFPPQSNYPSVNHNTSGFASFRPALPNTYANTPLRVPLDRTSGSLDGKQVSTSSQNDSYSDYQLGQSSNFSFNYRPADPSSMRSGGVGSMHPATSTSKPSGAAPSMPPGGLGSLPSGGSMSSGASTSMLSGNVAAMRPALHGNMQLGGAASVQPGGYGGVRMGGFDGGRPRGLNSMQPGGLDAARPGGPDALQSGGQSSMPHGTMNAMRPTGHNFMRQNGPDSARLDGPDAMRHGGPTSMRLGGPNSMRPGVPDTMQAGGPNTRPGVPPNISGFPSRIHSTNSPRNQFGGNSSYHSMNTDYGAGGGSSGSRYVGPFDQPGSWPRKEGSTRQNDPRGFYGQSGPPEKGNVDRDGSYCAPVSQGGEQGGRPLSSSFDNKTTEPPSGGSGGSYGGFKSDAPERSTYPDKPFPSSSGPISFGGPRIGGPFNNAGPPPRGPRDCGPQGFRTGRPGSFAPRGDFMPGSRPPIGDGPPPRYGSGHSRPPFFPNQSSGSRPWKEGSSEGLPGSKTPRDSWNDSMGSRCDLPPPPDSFGPPSPRGMERDFRGEHPLDFRPAMLNRDVRHGPPGRDMRGGLPRRGFRGPYPGGDRYDGPASGWSRGNSRDFRDDSWSTKPGVFSWQGDMDVRRDMISEFEGGPPLKKSRDDSRSDFHNQPEKRRLMDEPFRGRRFDDYPPFDGGREPPRRDVDRFRYGRGGPPDEARGVSDRRRSPFGRGGRSGSPRRRPFSDRQIEPWRDSSERRKDGRDDKFRERDRGRSRGDARFGSRSGQDYGRSSDRSDFRILPAGRTMEKSGGPPKSASPGHAAVFHKYDMTLVKLLDLPGRKQRPAQFSILLRGLPGAGKTHLARLIRNKEVDAGGAPPRILSLDDYFTQEVDKSVSDATTGRLVKKRVIEYSHDPSMENTYMQSLLKTFKKTVDDGLFPFIIVDAVNANISALKEFVTYGTIKGFQVFVAELETELKMCVKRNTHNRTQAQIWDIASKWEALPKDVMRLDVTALLKESVDKDVTLQRSVKEPPVPKEPAESEVDDKKDKVNEAPVTEEKAEEGSPEEQEEEKKNEDAVVLHVKSKWDEDPSEEKLAKMDGLSHMKRADSAADIESFLADLADAGPDDGSKKVRWADVEERKNQKQAHDLGFVVGSTDWNKILDTSRPEKALNQTKYF